MASMSQLQLCCIPVNAVIEEFIDAITKDGGCICTSYVTAEEAAQENTDVGQFRDADKYLLAGEQYPCGTSSDLD
jgi:hypothetical protein